jgi:hexosaminidase
VLKEVIELFPGSYIHIGGDEVDHSEWKKCSKCQARIQTEHLKDEHELQSYFVKRIAAFLRLYNKHLIGWDEIIEGDAPSEAIVMAWRGMDNGTAAARLGHDVVMTPSTHCYFDHYQGNQALEPLAIGGFTSLSTVYSFEPVPDSLTSEQMKHILGAQGNVWTEYIPTLQHIQYMALPRMAALAEVIWSPKELRSWSDFMNRLPGMLELYDKKKYYYAKSAY